MSDRRSEFFNGVIATVIGFGLGIGWDTWKDHRQQRQRDEAVSRAVSNDLEANLKSIDADLRTLNEELRLLPQGSFKVQPLTVMKVGFWEVAKINPPAELIISGRLGSLADLSERCQALNELLQSRETYRLHNESMSNFHDRMAIYDQLAIGAMQDVRNLIGKYPQSGAE